MAIVYRIFAGDSSGGPVDYTVVLDTMTGLSWTAPAPLADSTRTRYGVRAYDDVLLLDDGNTDAVVLIEIDAAGNDMTSRPRQPQAVVATPLAGGNVRLSWTYPYADRATAPQGFRVYKGPAGGSIDFGTVVGTSGYGAPSPPPPPIGARFSATVSGLADGTAYLFAVRAYNASGESDPSATAQATSDGTAPLNPANLTATATSSA